MKTISVLSLNLRFGLADDGPNAWKYRKQAIVKLFNGQHPDFISTQEANSFQIDFLVNHLPDYKYIGRRTPAPEFWQHNILFYDRSITCREHLDFFLSETPYIPSKSFGSHYPRQATLGLFQINGRSLICIDTHFDFETPAQMGAARVLKHQLAQYPKDIPLILTGDFNATPENECYRWLTCKEANGDEGLHLKETFQKPYPGTHHGFTGTPTAGYIDWILYRGPLNLVTCEVLQEPIGGIYPSDHFPVKAVFELQAQSDPLSI